MITYRFRYSATEYDDMTIKQVRRALEVQDAFLITILDSDWEDVILRQDNQHDNED